MSDDNPTEGSGEPPDPPRPPAPPPGNYPAFPPDHSMPQARPKDTWKIWLGIGLAIPVLIASGLLTGASGVIDDSGALSAIVGLACFAAPFVMLFFRATRKVAVGLLIGYAVILILFAGACIVLLASFGGG